MQCFGLYVEVGVEGTEGKAADGSKGGVHDVSLERISQALCPLGVGNRAG